MENLLSIIIANKDHAPTLARQLYSIKTQTEKFDEIIVIDDGSEHDNSKEVIQKFYDENKDELNIKIELNYENKGVVQTINTGFDMSECEYLYFGSADDYLLPEFAKWHKAIIKEHRPPMVTSDHNLPKWGSCKGVEDMGWYYIPGHCTSFERGALLEFGKFGNLAWQSIGTSSAANRCSSWSLTSHPSIKLMHTLILVALSCPRTVGVSIIYSMYVQSRRNMFVSMVPRSY